MNASAFSVLNVQPILGKPGFVRLNKPLQWRDIIAPEGMETDYDSVPRIPFIYAKYKGRTVYAAIMHDYMYRERLFSRKKCDQLFYEAMLDEGVSEADARAIYLAVRAFGWTRW